MVPRDAKSADEVRLIPAGRVLDERPLDGNERAVRAVTELLELVSAGKASRNSVLLDLIGMLFRHLVDGATAGYFADAPLSVESVASLLAEHVIHANGGLRVPKAGAIVQARLLRLVARHASTPKAAMSRVSYEAEGALGESDPRKELVRRDAESLLERYFREAINEDVANGDDFADAALGMALTFFKVHDAGFRVGDARALARKLERLLQRGERDAKKLVTVCARHVGIDARLFNFTGRRAKKRTST